MISHNISLCQLTIRLLHVNNAINFLTRELFYNFLSDAKKYTSLSNSIEISMLFTLT